MKNIYKSNRVYSEGGLISGYMTVENGKIIEISPKSPKGTDVEDFGNNRIIPGIFDTHNHGTHGYTLMDIESEQQQVVIKGYLKGLASNGVTNILPTCSGTMIKAVAEASDMENDGATIVGIHSEGPWLNRVGEKGVKTGWPEVSLDVAKKMVADGGGKLKLVAAAPEIEGIEKILDYFKSQGITLAFAHSELFYEASAKVIKNYFSVATHLGNVMTGMHHRDIGGLGACLMDEDMDCEIICDGMHISLKMLEVYFKMKDYSKFMMISDCTGFSGAPAGKYKGWDPSMSINVSEEGFVLSDTGRLCGSSKAVIFGIKNLVEKVGIPMETVIQMSSLNPCKKYGLGDTKGSLLKGKDADFVVIDDDYNAIKTYANGRKIYDCTVDTDLFNSKFLDAIRY